jgi:type I restriction enzyme S subunit
MDINDTGDYPVYGGNGLRGYYYKYSNDGDYILIGRQGALCGNINYAHGKFWATEHAVVCYPKREFAYKWLGELLRAMNLGQYSLSAAQPGLAVERINNLKMPLPPLNEQLTIADYLDNKCAEIDALITTKQQKIETLKDYKKSLIYEAVTGKIDIV